VLCKVSSGDVEEEHFLLVTSLEFLLVDPHKTKLGHGVVHFISFLQARAAVVLCQWVAIGEPFPLAFVSVCFSMG